MKNIERIYNWWLDNQRWNALIRQKVNIYKIVQCWRQGQCSGAVARTPSFLEKAADLLVNYTKVLGKRTLAHKLLVSSQQLMRSFKLTSEPPTKLEFMSGKNKAKTVGQILELDIEIGDQQTDYPFMKLCKEGYVIPMKQEFTPVTVDKLHKSDRFPRCPIG